MEEAVMIRWNSLRPLLLAAVIGVLSGLAVFVVAEAIAAVYLIGQQIELARATQAALSGGIAGLADSGLRELRLAAEQQAAQVHQRVTLLAILSGALAAVAALIRLEQPPQR
jgi:hypothetical protein